MLLLAHRSDFIARSAYTGMQRYVLRGMRSFGTKTKGKDPLSMRRRKCTKVSIKNTQANIAFVSQNFGNISHVSPRQPIESDFSNLRDEFMISEYMISALQTRNPVTSVDESDIDFAPMYKNLNKNKPKIVNVDSENTGGECE